MVTDVWDFLLTFFDRALNYIGLVAGILASIAAIIVKGPIAKRTLLLGGGLTLLFSLVMTFHEVRERQSQKETSVVDARQQNTTTINNTTIVVSAPSGARPDKPTTPDGLKNKSLASATPDRPVQPQKPPLVGEGLRAAISRSVSERRDLPYAVTATVNVTGRTQPFGLMFEGDATIRDAEFFVKGTQTFASTLQGNVREDSTKYYIGFASPEMSPEKPIVVTLYASKPFSLRRIDSVYLKAGS